VNCLRISTLAFVLAGASVAGAEEQQKSENTIVDLHVEGLRRVERETVLGDLESKAGTELDIAKITADLRRLWATGLFRDVRILRDRAPGGWLVIIQVVEKPSIREVKFLGRDELSEEDLKGVVDVRPFTILNTELLKKNVAKMKDLYVEKGYYLADITYRVDAVPGTDNEVDVVFNIVENAKVLVRQISIIGNNQLNDEEIKSVLQTREGGELSWLTQSGTYKEEFFQTDLFRIQALYYDHGFVAVKVGDPTATISPDRRYIYLSVPVTEGEKYNIGNIGFSGDVELKNEKGEVVVDAARLQKRMTVTSGEIFNRTKLFQDIQSLTDVYRDYGYAYANVTPNSQIKPDQKLVDLDLEVERGEVVYIERIEVVGNTRTRDKVVRREMRIDEGDRYSGTALNRSRARIFQLGFFETVNIATSRGSEPHLMNLTVEVKEKSTGTFQIGAGFSSVESFIATAQIAQNNFLGRGQSLSISAQLSFGDFARQLATLQFYEPYFLDTQWSFGLNAYITQRFYRDFQRNATGASPSLGYPLTPDLRVNVGYTLEQIEIATDVGGGDEGVRLRNLNRDGRNSAVNASIAYDTRDNRLFPADGQYHVLSGEISDPAIGSDEQMAYRRTQLGMRYYHPLAWGFVLKLNASFGWVFGGGPQGVPISERFFPGGIFSVRGFEPRGLGPTVPVAGEGSPNARTTEFTIGGNKEAVFNLEVEFPIIEAAGIKGVLFADAGNAYDDHENFFYVDLDEEQQPDAFLIRSGRRIKPPLGLYYSFGFGFRWFSPIGPLRFEWGIPITKRAPEDKDIIFEFTIGNFF
jgi:outer membrane protein insertion porin family